MLTLPKNTRGSAYVIIFAVIFLTVVLVVGAYRIKVSDDHSTTNNADIQVTQETKTKEETFSFSAAGDFSSNENADAVLSAIGKDNTNFTLALGDLGYAGNGTEEAWCSFVKQRVGPDHPFQIIAGNHDDGTKDGDIKSYSACLPNQIDGMVGDYGVEYYFDYDNLVRFILISPDINTYGFDYIKGNQHYDWVADTIDDAHKAGLKWVILGMHKNCITPGEKTCEIGGDLLDLAVEKKVDIILQGHEHAYFRSHQLAHSSRCLAITINSTNPECIVANNTKHIAGEGSTIVISGAGGQTLRNVNLDDGELGYFAAWNGANTGSTYGYTKITVSSDSIESEFIGLGPGKFKDSFTISKNN